MTILKRVSIATHKSEGTFSDAFFSERVSPKVSWDTKCILFYCVIKAWQSKISKQINKIYENICKTATIATGNGEKLVFTAKL